MVKPDGTRTVKGERSGPLTLTITEELSLLLEQAAQVHAAELPNRTYRYCSGHFVPLSEPLKMSP